ncbi:ammonium transporter, Amt family, partial [Phenoliferia sp. Uapishka_3]
MSNTTALNTPPWLDKGDNSWQLTAATLVGLQSIPGLMILYGGIVKRKWAINSAFMVLIAFAEVMVCWVIWAYKMGFGEQWGAFPLLGRPGPVLKITQELGQAILPASGGAENFPLSTMIWFQFVFAAITLILIAGAFLGRMNFLAWVVFVPLWLTFSYTVGAFSIWGGGFLFERGVMDYSGGYVIHLSSGTAGFVGAYWIGPRLASDRADFRPNNVLMAMAGVGLLWMGWTGFNGGDPYNAGTDAGVAVLNTHLCTSMSLLTWVLLDVIYFKKPSIIGAIQGIITGLVAITPAAGFVDGWGAIIIGFLSGSIPWVSMNIAGRKLRLFEHVDDTLGALAFAFHLTKSPHTETPLLSNEGVVHTHMVAGFVGGMATGVFATTPGSIAFAITNQGGAVEGTWKQLYIQLYGALFIVSSFDYFKTSPHSAANILPPENAQIGLNIFMTSLIMNFIKHVLRIPLRMSETHLLVGDESAHGECAYAFDERAGDHARAGDVEEGTVVHRHGQKNGQNGDME